MGKVPISSPVEKVHLADISVACHCPILFLWLSALGRFWKMVISSSNAPSDCSRRELFSSESYRTRMCLW